MKLQTLLSYLLIAILAISCSNREEAVTPPEYNPLTTKINLGIVLYGSSGATQLACYFEYNNAEKLTRKIGGYFGASPATGYSGFFSNEIYTTLVYAGNKITLEDFSTSTQFNVPKNNKYYRINSSDLVLEKEVPEPTQPNNMYWYKKQIYTYNNGILDEIRTTYPNRTYDPTDPTDYIISFSEKFFFDVSNNLIRTEYYELYNGVRNGEKIIRTFGNYDSSYNPYSRLGLLDEFFYRALSKNNFRSYKIEKTQNGNTNVSSQEWTFNYDSSGNIILD